MISEQQAEALLEECEKATGHPLTGLRKRLARHNKPYSNIWELITLYCTLPLGSIKHEPEPNCPDICIRNGNTSPLWIEAAYVYSRRQKRIDDAEEFVKRILDKVRAKEIPHLKGIHVDITAHDGTEAFSLPAKNYWKNLFQHLSWRRFEKSLADENSAEAEWICPKGNALVKLRKKPHSHGTSVGFRVYDEPNCPTEHPVYKEIKKKAAQAKKWANLGKSYSPLVLCIGASDSPEEINSPGCTSKVSLHQAACSALLDVRRMNMTAQVNITKRIDGKSFNVPGAKLISAIVVVTLESRTSNMLPFLRREPNAQLILNDQATKPLGPKELHLLQQIRFDRIEYRLGWEAWERPRDKKRSDHKQADRIKQQWGLASIRYLENGGFEVDLSADIVARLLSGDTTQKELSEQYKGDIPSRLRTAPKQGQRIINCEYLPSEPGSRNLNYIRLKYGPPKPPVIADPEKSRKG